MIYAARSISDLFKHGQICSHLGDCESVCGHGIRSGKTRADGSTHSFCGGRPRGHGAGPGLRRTHFCSCSGKRRGKNLVSPRHRSQCNCHQQALGRKGRACFSMGDRNRRGGRFDRAWDGKERSSGASGRGSPHQQRGGCGSFIRATSPRPIRRWTARI